jgi:hypothetical protein
MLHLHNFLFGIYDLQSRIFYATSQVVPRFAAWLPTTASKNERVKKEQTCLFNQVIQKRDIQRGEVNLDRLEKETSKGTESSQQTSLAYSQFKPTPI